MASQPVHVGRSPDQLGMLSMRAVGRLATLIYVAGGAGSLVSALTLGVDDGRGVLMAASMAAVATGLVLWRLPWARLPRWTVYAVVPPGVALVMVVNAVVPRPAVAAVYFAVAGTWAGMVSRPGAALVTGPVLAVLYVLAMARHDAVAALRVAPYVAALGAGTGELLSRLAQRIQQAEEKLHALKERRFEAMVERSADVTARALPNRVLAYVSPATVHTLGHDPNRLVGLNLDDYVDHYVHGDDRGRAQAFIDDTFAVPGREQRVELHILHGDGSWRDIEVRAANLCHDEAVEGVVFNLHDISERKELERELTHRAYTDALTGLANRAAFQRVLLDATDAALVHDRRLALLFIDVDRFKDVNDHLGHEAGDQLLADIAGALRRATDRSRCLARLGGDEFAAILEGDDVDRLPSVARAVADAVRRPVDLGGTVTEVTASIGVAHLTDHGGTPVASAASDVLRRADIAMYRAKRAGGDRWYDGGVHGHRVPSLSA